MYLIEDEVTDQFEGRPSRLFYIFILQYENEKSWSQVD